MKRGHLPLTALRTFESAGRLQSFTLAAEELFVSQAAVSRQIRELEARTQTQLFERRHRRVVLTVAGARLLATLTDAFDGIARQMDNLPGRQSSGPLTINSEPSFAAYWLAPNLDKFRSRHPDLDIAIESDTRLVEFRTGRAELAIRFSQEQNHWPRTEAHHLTSVHMTTFVAPDYLACCGPLNTPADLLTCNLLHEDNHECWIRWFSAAGIQETGTISGPVFADGGLIFQSVLRGQGIGLADRRLIQTDLDAGRLVQPFETRADYGHYWLVARDFKSLSPAGAKFAQWIGDAFS